jgi:hypothetical protein
MKTATKIFMVMLVMFIFTSQAFSQATATTTTKEVKKENTVTSPQATKDGKNCPKNDNCCKSKANDNCCKEKAGANCGKGSDNCVKGSANCGKSSANCGKGSAACTGMKSANCQGQGKSQCGNKSASPTPAPGKGDNK